MSASVAYPRRRPLDNEQGRLWCTVSRATYANEDRQPSWFRVGVPSKEATDLVSGLVRLTGWPLELLTELLAVQASQDGQTWPPVALGAGRAALLFPRYYRHLGAAIDTLRRTGLTLDEVARVLDARQSSQTRAAQLRKLIKKRFEDSAWQSAVKAGQDRIRARKRDALVSYLVGSDSRFRSADDIFAYYLIDPEMGACMPSSRIVQAHGAVQLFVQRCLMGLEPEVKIPPRQAPDWDAWKWMKYFRVWEAARKIFLYPEDWLEPELRDDKSEFFRQLEDEINQNDMTPDNLKGAVVNYLQKLREVARLAVCAAYYEFDERKPLLHVLARTPGEPHKYFYRRWVAERYWTPWESVDLEISGDHHLLYVHNGRLQLAWATFKQLEVKPELPETFPTGGGQPKVIHRILRLNGKSSSRQASMPTDVGLANRSHPSPCFIRAMPLISSTRFSRSRNSVCRSTIRRFRRCKSRSCRRTTIRFRASSKSLGASYFRHAPGTHSHGGSRRMNGIGLSLSSCGPTSPPKPVRKSAPTSPTRTH
ncbi:MAG: neuraminidase-like domain-containing protein [Xanthobacteraceae bacterium]